MLEGRDGKGYVWISDSRNGDYFYLKDFEHLVVTKVSDTGDREHWDAIIFEDETCSKVIGKEEFATEEEAKHCLERVMELALKNRYAL